MKSLVLVAALLASTATAYAEAQKYTLEANHSQVVFSYDHFGFSTTYGMYSGFEGEIMFDETAPENSKVNVSMPVKSMLTGWEPSYLQFMSADFFDAKDGDLIAFTSTGITVTGDATAMITGDLSMNGVTNPVILDARLNRAGIHPFFGAPWLGFDATTSLLRSDYNLGAFAPDVSDEIKITISIEAKLAI